MLSPTIANIGIILLNCYVLFKSDIEVADKNKFSLKELFTYISIQVITGILLINYSTIIDGVRIDLCFVFYAISMKYWGWKVTIPTMFFVSISRFFLDIPTIALIGFFFTLFMMVSLPFLEKVLKEKCNDFEKLVILVIYSLLTNIFSIIPLFSDYKQILQVSFILSINSFLLTFISYRIITDLQDMVDLVNLDYLTELYNKRSFENDISRYDKSDKRFSVIILDIDFFKHFNDLYGHHAGDLILQEVAKIFSQFSEPTRRFYRIGGEEFVVLLPDNGPINAAQLAEKIQEELRELKVYFDGNQVISVTISIGVASQEGNEDLKRTVARADLAMYNAKKNGRNQISIA